MILFVQMQWKLHKNTHKGLTHLNRTEIHQNIKVTYVYSSGVRWTIVVDKQCSDSPPEMQIEIAFTAISAANDNELVFVSPVVND